MTDPIAVSIFLNRETVIGMVNSETHDIVRWVMDPGRIHTMGCTLVGCAYPTWVNQPSAPATEYRINLVRGGAEYIIADVGDEIADGLDEIADGGDIIADGRDEIADGLDEIGDEIADGKFMNEYWVWPVTGIARVGSMVRPTLSAVRTPISAVRPTLSTIIGSNLTPEGRCFGTERD